MLNCSLCLPTKRLRLSTIPPQPCVFPIAFYSLRSVDSLPDLDKPNATPTQKQGFKQQCMRLRKFRLNVCRRIGDKQFILSVSVLSGYRFRCATPTPSFSAPPFISLLIAIARNPNIPIGGIAAFSPVSQPGCICLFLPHAVNPSQAQKSSETPQPARTSPHGRAGLTEQPSSLFLGTPAHGGYRPIPKKQLSRPDVRARPQPHPHTKGNPSPKNNSTNNAFPDPSVLSWFLKPMLLQSKLVQSPALLSA